MVTQKCGYSTFENMVKHGICERYNNQQTSKQVFLVRDPYSRLESFYKDKMIKNIDGLKQHCQKSLCKYFTTQDLLQRNISFESFILEAIAKNYQDGHVSCLHNRYPAVDENTTLINITKDSDQLRELLNIELLPRTNSTQMIDVDINWTQQMKLTVYNRYKQDFSKFKFKQ